MYFCGMKWAAMMCGIWAMSSWASGQTDSLPALPAFRVQIPRDTATLDSLWADTTWHWSGSCPTPRLTVRLVDPTTGHVAQRSFPCLPSIETPTTSAYVTPVPTGYTIDLSLTRSAAAAWTWGPPETCFPPLPMSAFEAATPAWDELIFEREQLDAMIAWSENRCLSPGVVRACLLRLESEDRRLQLLTALVPRCSQPSALKLDDLFILRTTRAKAAQLVGK